MEYAKSIRARMLKMHQDHPSYQSERA